MINDERLMIRENRFSDYKQNPAGTILSFIINRLSLILTCYSLFGASFKAAASFSK